jgi:hypothetical protein
MRAGEGWIRFDVAATVLFALTASYAAIDFSTLAQWIGAATAMVLFAIGVFAFLWSYWNAVQRSRASEIAVSQLYLLLGQAIPTPVRRVMLLCLGAQLAIALTTTLARPNGPDGNPGSSLVPMLGFGLNGMWAIRHGQFAVRVDRVASSEDVPHSGKEIGQNAHHG